MAPASMRTLTGNLAETAWSTSTPITARFPVCSSGFVPTVSVFRWAERRITTRMLRPGVTSVRAPRSSAGVWTLWPSASTITSPGWSPALAAGDPGSTSETTAPLGVTATSVSERALSDDRRDLLGAGHREQVALLPLLVAGPGRIQRL